jgi:hypothetical protein
VDGACGSPIRSDGNWRFSAEEKIRIVLEGRAVKKADNSDLS